MRRSTSEIPLSPNLLLDTLCNALGGVIFIALLVVLIASRAPLGESQDDAEKNKAAETRELVEELKSLPSKTALAQSLQDYTRAEEDYAKTALVPASPTESREILLAERARLLRLAGAPTNRQRPVYAVPAIRKAPDFEAGYVVVFKHASVYSAPLTGELVVGAAPYRPFRVQNLVYTVGGHAVQIDTCEDAGQTVSAAINKLFSEIQNTTPKRVVPSKTKLFLYVYPDSVAAFHLYRKQAMQTMPNVIWFGVPDHEFPSILLSENRSGGDEDLSF